MFSQVVLPSNSIEKARINNWIIANDLNFKSENIIRGEIKTSNFAKGVYILNIQQGNKVLNKKVIIK